MVAIEPFATDGLGLVREAGEAEVFRLPPDEEARDARADVDLTLLEAMHSEGIHRLVFSSTAALYGEQERIPIEETHPLGPASVYGESKLLVERMLEWFQKVHGLRYASLRYFNAAGATGERGEDHAPETHLIPLALQVALGKRASVQIYGTDYPTPDGTCVRDYIHVQDLATAHPASGSSSRPRAASPDIPSRPRSARADPGIPRRW